MRGIDIFVCCACVYWLTLCLRALKALSGATHGNAFSLEETAVETMGLPDPLIHVNFDAYIRIGPRDAETCNNCMITLSNVGAYIAVSV